MGIKSKINYVKNIIQYYSVKAQNNTELTPITEQDIEDKAEFLDYVNAYYRDELGYILSAFTAVRTSTDVLPMVEDVYQQGVLLRYMPEGKNNGSIEDTMKALQQNIDSRTVFIAFRVNNLSIEERFYYLGYEASIKRGILPEINKRHYFTVLGKKHVSANMLRVYIESDVEIPTDNPGYAYYFILNRFNHQSKKINSIPFKMIEFVQSKVKNDSKYTNFANQVLKQGFMIAFLVEKHLAGYQARKMDNNSESHEDTDIIDKKDADSSDKKDKKQGRYYTLRQVKKVPKSNANHKKKKEMDGSYHGEIDIYLHGETAGGMWAQTLQMGDIIYATHEYEESIKDMTVGQALLICDETSMPTVVAALERWETNVAPMVICITNDVKDFEYFNNLIVPEDIKDKITIKHIELKNTNDVASQVIDYIQLRNTHIDCAWGAFGNREAKQVKKYIKETYGITGKLNRVRGYW